ncbi:NAD-dependent epimerase [Actinorhabdospora filicis]|uniref:NAD-dependent epimerase n=1 Tax=Actinorhabdospora filicis TaxID=1785913 RepID=A0A9W6SQZ3_9ACTN|nr:NAD-dependent epimerase/dehydratase family protein [Actinorhabdospora filicis]GLZ81340.1 NAD-dependent epimerase [Actinorhabdospora filicis]
MSTHVIVGAGGTGAATARLLAERGDRVRLVTRKGTGPAHPLIDLVRLDALDTEALAELTEGAAALYNAAMPDYTRWPELLPPLYASILLAAEHTGVPYVMLGNLYAYGPSEAPLTEDTPLNPVSVKGRVRADVWRAALDAHRAGRVRVAEVRSGQFLGPGAVSSFSLLAQPKVLAGRLALIDGEPDVPHSYTSTVDAAHALIAVAGSTDDADWGRAWHAPAISATPRELATRLAALTGSPEPRLEALTEREMELLAVSVPFFGELPEMAYMSHKPLHVDATAIEKRFGLRAEDVDEVLRSGL